MLSFDVMGRHVRFGTLHVTDATGRTYSFAGEGGPEVAVRLTDRRFLRRFLFRPELTVGEAYMDGRLVIEQGSLYGFLEIMLASREQFQAGGFQKLVVGIGDRIKLLLAANSVARARRNATHHYDLKDELFELFLDSDRQYSCGYFPEPDADIETAQHRKKLHIAAKLLPETGTRLLDIGSGWGGLGMFVARFGTMSVDGVTLSHEQHAYSNRKARESGLDNRVRFHLKDYREVDETYDRIVSVGMLEHVGPANYGAFYRRVARLLSEDGIALIHCIGAFRRLGPINSWMSRYIFPGGYIPALSEQMEHIEKAGLLVTDIEILRKHYAETLRLWNEAFQRNREKAREMYDERFCRMWEFYLNGCEICFRRKMLMVFQIQLAKSMEAVPMTRDYVHDFERRHLAGAGAPAA